MNSIIEHKVEGIFLRADYSEYISESFAKRYYIDLKNYIAPFGYFDQENGTLLNNGDLPDGTYVILGKMQYPSKYRMARHTIMQFNLCRVRGVDLDILRPFNPYPDVPDALKANLRPKFPMFKIEQAHAYKALIPAFLQIADSELTKDELKDKIFKLPENSVVRKLYSLRLALLRDMEK